MSNLILIVDDTTQNLQVVGKMLKNEGYKVAAVNDGEEALDFVKQRIPDLVLLDIMMPGLNGYQVCRKLSKMPQLKEIPVIFISALNELENKIKGFEVGGVDYITKPFRKQEVLARVKTHLELRKNKKRVKEYAERLEKRNYELEQLQEELNEQLKQAKQIHQKFLPDDLMTKNLAIGTYYQLTQQLGGDFYNYIQYNDLIIAYVVDITGHGLDGALLNIFVRDEINNFLQEIDNQDDISPADILKDIYQKYNEESFVDDYFICIGIYILDKVSLELTYSNAGLQLPALLLREDEIIELNNKGLPISTAINKNCYDFTTVEINLNIGDKFLLMTDGLIEEKSQEQRYGLERFKQVAQNYNSFPIHGLIDKIRRDFKNYIVEDKCQDDVTLFGLEIKYELLEEEQFEIKSSFTDLAFAKNKVRKIIDPTCIDIDELIMALHEILSNAIKHGNKETKERSITISLEVTKEYVEIIVEDEGTGFDWESTLASEELYDNYKESGRGLRIADLACDSIYYNQKGNKVTLIKMKE
ncbi:MAG: response regulator [Bacillota bacterium]